MKKNIYFWGVFFFLITGCSSMPKDERSQYVGTAREQSALQLDRGNNEYRWNNYVSALTFYKKALREASSVDWQEGIVRSMVQISRTLDQLGHKDDALKYANTARDFQKDTTSRELDVLTLNRLAEWHFLQNEIQQALTLLDDAIAAGKGLESQEAGETWRVKAAIHKKQSHYSEALSAIDTAVELDNKGFFLGELASDYYIKSSILSLSGEYKEAVESMEQALEKDKFIENSAGIAMDLFGLGKIHEKFGNSEKALIYYKRLYLVYLGTENGTVPGFLLDSIKILSKNEIWLSDIDIP
jgi:hypothetical protein